jgi:hypothetical protein
MKKTILFLLVLLLPGVATVFAQGGDFGENNALHWELNNGTLTISGTGAMPGYSYPDAPWYSNRSSIETVIIEDGVTSIGYRDFAIYYSALTSVTIGNGVTSIEEEAFYDCSNLASVTIGNSVTSIGEEAFYCCFALTSVTIGNSVTSIGEGAFRNCSSLTSVTIPNSVTSIGVWAFYNCINLDEIHNNSSVPQSINNDCFTGVNTTGCFLYVPTGSKAAYQTAMGWRSFQNIYEENVSAIGEINPSAIRVYSNPATASFRIEGLSAPAQVTVISAGGQTVWRQTVGNGESLATGYLPSGVYLVNVNGQTIKIIK